MDDTIQVLEKHNVSSQSFCFHPEFLNTAHFSEVQGYMSVNLKIKTGLWLFRRDNLHTEVHVVTEKLIYNYLNGSLSWGRKCMHRS